MKGTVMHLLCSIFLHVAILSSSVVFGLILNYLTSIQDTKPVECIVLATQVQEGEHTKAVLTFFDLEVTYPSEFQTKSPCTLGSNTAVYALYLP